MSSNWNFLIKTEMEFALLPLYYSGLLRNKYYKLFLSLEIDYYLIKILSS